MKDLGQKGGVWFVYDGECPVCAWAARVLKIKKKYGTLYLVNAREAKNDPLLEEIKSRGLNLDEGMVIYASGRFYHGKEALKFIAEFGDTLDILMALCRILFWSDTISSPVYAWMRRMRNFLLRCRGVGQIDNLN